MIKNLKELVDAAIKYRGSCCCPDDGFPHRDNCKEWLTALRFKHSLTTENVLKLLKVVEAAQEWEESCKTLKACRVAKWPTCSTQTAFKLCHALRDLEERDE